ncbi:crotonase [candidate division WOR-3 bacterium]|uniref:Crotonase n=1 Tax=candidate division WOR-3 bacterium TaxID=2052148 RepID=A0A937XFL0_UNCW3|nr:crotonase [candidate division WOR-3 bacterium]
MDFKYLVVRKEDGIGWLKVNRPPMNALNTDVVLELDRAMDWFAHEDDVLVVVIYGEGKMFVAGADIAEMTSFTPMQARDFARRGHRAFGKIASMDKPVIAAVNGYALGGGCELAIACDIRVLADTVKIGQPEVNLGLIPGFGGTQRLARLVGPGIAKELILSADAIDAAEALRIGLANKVVPADKLVETVTEMAKKIASKGPTAVKLAKACINLGLDTDLANGNSYEIEAFGVCFSTKEPAIGTAAFLSKQKPDWKAAKE